uniref:IQ motif containing K n=1 Tax=Myotis myotis TaxID=51298 RepID=A0A7J7XZT1_MYOMY|nr:IQ motif containing K [Myotis myotis]
MAAPGRVGSRAAQHEERAGSLESVPTACPAALERPAEPPGRTLWERICEEYEAELPPFPEGYKIKQEAMITVSPMEETLFRGFSAEHRYPFPQWATDSHIPCTQIKLETIDPKTCSPKEYLETFIFPVLLPGIASLLHQAKKEKCFEVRCDPEIQELRQWQKKLREDKHIRERVRLFWAKQEQKGGLLERRQGLISRDSDLLFRDGPRAPCDC